MKNIFYSLTVLCTLMSCMSYYKSQKVIPVSSKTLSLINSPKKYFILHNGDSAWHISDLNIAPAEFSGKLSSLPAKRFKFKTTKNGHSTRYKNTRASDESYVLDEVHLFLIGDAMPGLKAGSSFSIAYNEIINAEIYAKDKGKTNLSWLLPGIGIPVVIVGVMAIIAANMTFALNMTY